MERREELEGDKEKWVHDSSVDHKGRTPLRASTGIWKASFFIIGKQPSIEIKPIAAPSLQVANCFLRDFRRQVRHFVNEFSC